MNTKEYFTSLRACDKAITLAGERTLEQCWHECDRGDWLLWWAARVGVDRALIIRATCACARRGLRFIPAGEDRPRLAIETAEAYARGEATIEQVHAAADAAWAAAAHAAHEAARAARAAGAAADSACSACIAAAAADAAWATADAACESELLIMADIVREMIPWEAMASMSSTQLSMTTDG